MYVFVGTNVLLRCLGQSMFEWTNILSVSIPTRPKALGFVPGNRFFSLFCCLPDLHVFIRI